MAKPGTAYLSVPTYKLARDFCEFRSLGKVAVIGIKSPIRFGIFLPGRALFGSTSNFVNHSVNFHFTAPFPSSKPIREPVFTSAFNDQGHIFLGNNVDFHAE